MSGAISKKTVKNLNSSTRHSFLLNFVERLLDIFTTEGDCVLDPFMGSGSTLTAAKTKNRMGIGVELSEDFIKIAQERLSEANLFATDPEPQIIAGDAQNLTELITKEIDFVLTSPPYWNILNQQRTADKKNIRHYSNLKKDLGAIKDYSEFLGALKKVFTAVYKLLKNGGYCCIILMDIRKGTNFYPFHIDTCNFMRKIGFTLDDIIIWDRRSEYNNLRPLGYPYVFRVNKVHEYILIFKK